MNTGINDSRRQEVRSAVQMKMDLCIGDETIQATSVNVSDSGVQLEVREPIKFWIRMEADGEAVVKGAQIVWASRKDDSSMSYGFEYTDDNE